MFVIHLFVVVVAALCGRSADACYQYCSASFTHRIQVLQDITDQQILSNKSCQAMAEHIMCLEEKRFSCDETSLQYINSILNFMLPDYERTCVSYETPSGTSSPTVLHGLGILDRDASRTPSSVIRSQCHSKADQCYRPFNHTFTQAFTGPSYNWTVACDSLDSYTVCVEDLMPECGQHLKDYVTGIRRMQMYYTTNCSASDNPLGHTECVNDTLDCYEDFNAAFFPASNQYQLEKMCSALDIYRVCLNRIHTRAECHLYTSHALTSLQKFKTQYAIYCGTDGGQHSQMCVRAFHQCYVYFNSTYFPAMHAGNMKGICTSVSHYSQCVQPLYENCGLQMAKAFDSVRVLKEQFALQCDPEFQRLSTCRPLGQCLAAFSRDLSEQSEATSSYKFCLRLKAYFPCVEDSLTECNIPPEDTSVDFSQLGSLLGAYCQHLLGNNVLNSCEEFETCTSGLVLVPSAPVDPSAMFDADTWCSYMDMALSCVQRAVNTVSCGLEHDDTIIGHLKQQRELKRDICKLASVPPIPTEPPQHGGPDHHGHGHDHGHGHQGGHDGADAMLTRAGVMSLVCLTVISLLFQHLF